MMKLIFLCYCLLPLILNNKLAAAMDIFYTCFVFLNEVVAYIFAADSIISMFITFFHAIIFESRTI